ncbi:hypothetical protein [Candidatus Williamhamiltonella defendens]|uniref:hypothetical protein n=1 Tax=Candidatus Williamhamiltonella defendens TaxID=138072 RepID=UPI00165194C7|nr:hypothetical protein [Candidatus Hamiltonella defensa]
MHWERKAAKRKVALASPVVKYEGQGLEQHLINLGKVIDNSVKKIDLRTDKVIY